jgi:hypothetical protein
MDEGFWRAVVNLAEVNLRVLERERGQLGKGGLVTDCCYRDDARWSTSLVLSIWSCFYQDKVIRCLKYSTVPHPLGLTRDPGVAAAQTSSIDLERAIADVLRQVRARATAMTALQ